MIPGRHKILLRGRIRLRLAQGARGRLLGLLGRATPPGSRTGLWLSPCRAIHTWGMRYAIDVAFIGADGRVLRVDRQVGPGRLRHCKGARSVIELAINPADSNLRYQRKLRAALCRAGGARPGVVRPSAAFARITRNASAKNY